MSIRYVDIEGTVVSVSLEHVKGEWVAHHEPTNAFGCGRTEDDAVEALRVFMVIDRNWFCGIGGDLHLTGMQAHRRDTYQQVFCKKGEAA